MAAGSDCMACHVPKGVYHTCKSMKSGTVIFEFKNGKYEPNSDVDILQM